MCMLRIFCKVCILLLVTLNLPWPGTCIIITLSLLITRRSLAEITINRNVSYETTEMIVNRNISYETIADSNQPSQPLPSERNRVSASLSENYNSEPHLAMAASARPGGDGGAWWCWAGRSSCFGLCGSKLKPEWRTWGVLTSIALKGS